MKKNNSFKENFYEDENFWNGIIIIGILTLFFILLFLFYNIHDSKKNCLEIGGDYSFKVNFPPKNLCDGKEFIKYEGKWEFKEDLERIWSDFRYNP